MSIQNAEKPTRLFNKLEEEVFAALRGLPPGYDVLPNPEEVKFDAEGISYRYEPDIVVSDPAGRRLIVEVKSHHSLSLSNMAKLAAIQRRIKSEGMEFLVIVADAQSIQPANKMREFGDLHLSYSHGPTNVVPAVLGALNGMSTGAGGESDDARTRDEHVIPGVSDRDDK